MASRVRRWGALAIGIALGLGGVFAALLVPPVSYQATAQMVLLLPTTPTADGAVVNPYLHMPDGMVTLARAAVLSARGEEFTQNLVADGFTSTFELDSEVRAPIVRFSVMGGDEALVDADLARVLSSFSDVLGDMQRGAGVPDRELATAHEFDSVPATAVSGDRLRAAVAAAFLGIATALVAVRWTRATADRAGAEEFSASGRVATRSERHLHPQLRGGRGHTTGRSTHWQGGPDRWGLVGVVFLVIYAGLLLVVPSRLGVAAIGGPGKPASLWALLGLVLWVVLAATGQVSRGPRAIRLATGLLGAAALLSYIAGNVVGWYQPADIHQRSDSRWRLVTQSELNDVMVSAGDRGLIAMAGWLGIALLTAEGMRSWKDLEHLVTWVVRFAAVVAALGVLQYFTNVNVAAVIEIPGLSTTVEFTTFTRSVLNRVVSTAGHPIELGVNMAALFPLALHRSLHTKKLLTWVPTGLLALMAFMSVSRAAVVVLACAAAVLFWGWPNRWRVTAIVVLPILAVLARSAFPGLLGTISALFRNLQSDPSVDGRTQDYPFVMRAFTENPLFGRGVYTWGTYYFRTLDNQVLMSLVEIGVVGVLAFGALILAAIAAGLRCRRYAQDPRNGHLGLALAASITGMTASYFMFDTLGFNQASGLAFLLFGMAGAAYRLAMAERDADPGATVVEDRPGRAQGESAAAQSL